MVINEMGAGRGAGGGGAVFCKMHRQGLMITLSRHLQEMSILGKSAPAEGTERAQASGGEGDWSVQRRGSGRGGVYSQPLM